MVRTHGLESISFFVNDTDPTGAINDSLPVYSPDTMMQGVARFRERFLGYTDFFASARNGTLPKLSWVMPTWDNCDHPCHDVANGERLLKDLYEALRAGKGWERTLFAVVYDDTGGMYDHVVPPHEGVPSDDAACHIKQGCPTAFDFRRLGMRTSAMLISPWLPKNSLFQEPRGPTPTSQFEHSSIPATVKALFGLPAFLTKRDAWAGSFDELLTLDTPRTDTPLHLPDAPPPHAGPCISPCPPPAASHDGDGDDGRRRLARPTPARAAQHCSASSGQCAGVHAVSNKQRHMIEVYGALTQTPSPNVAAMDFAAAGRWIGARQREWRAQAHALPGEGGQEGPREAGAATPPTNVTATTCLRWSASASSAWRPAAGAPPMSFCRAISLERAPMSVRIGNTNNDGGDCYYAKASSAQFGPPPPGRYQLAEVSSACVVNFTQPLRAQQQQSNAIVGGFAADGSMLGLCLSPWVSYDGNITRIRIPGELHLSGGRRGECCYTYGPANKQQTCVTLDYRAAVFFANADVQLSRIAGSLEFKHGNGVAAPRPTVAVPAKPRLAATRSHVHSAQVPSHRASATACLDWSAATDTSWKPMKHPGGLMGICRSISLASVPPSVTVGKLEGKEPWNPRPSSPPIESRVTLSLR